MSDLIKIEDAIEEISKGVWNVHELIDRIKKLPSATCDDCIWHVCNYNKIDWDGDDGYISRRDAINAIENTDAEITAEEWDELTNAIKSLPSADRPNGEWKYLHGSMGSYMTIHCPFCGNTFNDVAEWKYNYCPSCGARMKGGDDE